MKRFLILSPLLLLNSLFLGGCGVPPLNCSDLYVLASVDGCSTPIPNPCETPNSGGNSWDPRNLNPASFKNEPPFTPDISLTKVYDFNNNFYNFIEDYHTPQVILCVSKNATPYAYFDSNSHYSNSYFYSRTFPASVPPAPDGSDYKTYDGIGRGGQGRVLIEVLPQNTTPTAYAYADPSKTDHGNTVSLFATAAGFPTLGLLSTKALGDLTMKTVADPGGYLASWPLDTPDPNQPQGGLTFSWTDPQGTNIGSDPKIKVTPSQLPSTYKVTITYSAAAYNGNPPLLETAQASVTVYPITSSASVTPSPLNISVIPQSATYNNGTTQQLQVIASGGTKPYSYLWHIPTGSSDTFDNPTSATPNLTIRGNGTFNFTVDVTDSSNPPQVGHGTVTITETTP